MKYILLILGIFLMIFHSNFGWILSEPEAIAAVSQVKTGLDYATGRTIQTTINSTKNLIELLGSICILSSIFFFIKDLHKTKNK